MDAGTTQLRAGETVADTARVLSRMVDAIMIRTDDQCEDRGAGAHATVPVINGLTDQSHPCQIMADLLTIIEQGHSLPGLQPAWLGDGNNVCEHSLSRQRGLMSQRQDKVGIGRFWRPDSGFVRTGESQRGSDRDHPETLEEAVAGGAQVVVTDCWISMGQAGW